MRKGTKSGRIVMRLEINQIWQNYYEDRNQPSLVDIYKTVKKDPHLVDFHKFVYPNEERNQIWQNCYEVRNQPSLTLIPIYFEISTRAGIFLMVRNLPNWVPKYNCIIAMLCCYASVFLSILYMPFCFQIFYH